MNRQETLYTIKSTVHTFLPGAQVLLFGSRARGKHVKRFSDLDLAVKSCERLTLSQLADLSEAFSESDLPFKVDVVDCRSVGPDMQAAIDRDGVEI